MRKILRSIVVLIWIIDILNINFVFNGVSIAEFMDVTIPFNTLAWILTWIFVL